MAKKSAKGAGTIRKKTVTRNGKPYTYWEARITTGRDPGTGKQIQRPFTGKTQKEVREKMQAAAVEINQGTYTAPSKMTVGQWLDIWERDCLGSVKPLTVQNYFQHIKNHLKPAMGAIRLEALDAPTIQKLYNALSADHAPKTVKNIHGVLHKALQQAVKVGYIRFNSADACELPLMEKKEIKPLDEAATAAFLQAVQGHRFEAVYLTMLFTGLPGEFHLVPTKNSKRRTITVAPSVVKLLKRHKAQQAEAQLKAGPLWEDTGFVFCNEIGERLSPNTVYHNYKRVVASIGFPEARLHDLRHSFAVAPLRAGDDLKTVQDNLGHATASFTLDVYGHVTEEMKQASADRMEQYIKRLSANKQLWYKSHQRRWKKWRKRATSHGQYQMRSGRP